MGLEAQYPAYGGRGPVCLRVGLGLAALATVLIFLRLYVRLRISTAGTKALIWAIAAWVSVAFCERTKVRLATTLTRDAGFDSDNASL